MTQQSPIKTHADGSIDYGHYTAKGRTARSLAVHKTLANMARYLGKLIKACITLAPLRILRDRSNPHVIQGLLTKA